jgi:hypothetical protein
MGERGIPDIHQKWTELMRDMMEGDFMLKKDETAASQTYKYAQVVRTHEGSDGKVISADVEYKIQGKNMFRVTHTQVVHDSSREKTKHERRRR